jgi:hypothetical protein
MHRPGEQLLTGTCFPTDQDGHITVFRNPPRAIQYFI